MCLVVTAVVAVPARAQLGPLPTPAPVATAVSTVRSAIPPVPKPPPLPTVAVPTVVPVPTVVRLPTVVRVPTVVAVPTSVPHLPVALPRVSVPGVARSVGGGATAAGRAAGRPQSGSGDAPAASAAGSPSGGGRSSAGPSSGGSRRAAPAGSSRRAGGPRASRAGRLVRRRDQRLRVLVLGARGCLAALRRAQRRLLSLRAGVGRAAPLPRGRVARELNLSLRQVVRAERRGLRRLRRLDAAGGCAAPSAGVALGEPTAPNASVETAAFRTSANRANGTAAAPGARARRGAAHPGANGDAGRPRGPETAVMAGVAAPEAPRGGATNAMVALILFLLGAGAWGIMRVARREPVARPPETPPWVAPENPPEIPIPPRRRDPPSGPR
jgi:hypothetical protein